MVSKIKSVDEVLSAFIDLYKKEKVKDRVLQVSPYIYKCTVTRIVDGDTVDVDIDLGFSVVLKKQRIRLYAIDTPESRTRDKVEKKFGLASKQYLVDMINSVEHVYLKSHDKGKFGRILGELFIDGDTKSINMHMVDNHHAVYYYGQNKDDVQQEHLINREWLIKNKKI